jgi:AcrR family transcriptional regulator
MTSHNDPTHDRIVAAALRVINNAGTSSVRVIEVCKEAEVSQGMIRYHFGDRQGLIDAALARRFGERFGEFLTVFAASVADCSDEKQFRQVVQKTIDAIFTPERTVTRFQRNSDVGEAANRPPLAQKIAVERDAAVHALSNIIIDAQSRGLMRSDVDPFVVAAFHNAVVHGYSVFEVGNRSLDMAAFVELYRRALFGLIFN